MLRLPDFKRDCVDPAVRMRQAIRNILFTFDDEFRQFGRDLYVEVVE
jgi:ATP-dependent Lon protease